MSDVHKNYLFGLGYLLREKALEAKEDQQQARGSGDKAFESGRLMAYQEVMSLLISEAESFQLPIEDLHIDGLEPNRDLRQYPLPGSTPWINKAAREDSERAIGRLCMAFQELEELVSCLIGLLISDDNQLGTILTAELSFRNKLGLLYSLYLYRAAVSIPPETFKALLGKLHRAEERRNTILHSNWIKAPGCGMLTRHKYTAKSGKGFVHHAEDFVPAHIEAIVTETRETADDVIAHFDKAFPATATDKVLQVLESARTAAFMASDKRT